MYNALITFNTTACRILDSKLSSSPPPMALIALSFVEFPAGISLSKLSFYGQQLMRKNRGNRMGEDNISALGIKLAMFVWGSQVVYVPFLFQLQSLCQYKNKCNCFQNTDNRRHFSMFL